MKLPVLPFPRRERAEPAPLPPAPVASPAAVRRLHLQVTRRLDGLLHGDHLGHLPGPGTEPGEARAYVPGDDVRRIDWAVTARSGDVHVRNPIAERELETTLVVDLSPSMSFGTARTEKREVAVAVAVALGHLAQGPGDRLGALVLGDRVQALPPRPGRDAALALLHVLTRTRPADAATGGERPRPSLADVLDQAARTTRRRGLAVVVSDLLSGSGLAEPAWERPLRRLGARHDLVVVEVIDPREMSLPAVGVLSLVDPETGQALDVDTSNAKLRERYAAAAEQSRARHAAAVRRAGGTHVVVHTDRDWLPELARALQIRRRTRAAGLGRR